MEAHHHSVRPDAGRNSGRGQIKKNKTGRQTGKTILILALAEVSFPLLQLSVVYFDQHAVTGQKQFFEAKITFSITYERKKKCKNAQKHAIKEGSTSI